MRRRPRRFGMLQCSDRGAQYCRHGYRQQLQVLCIITGTTDRGHRYQKAVAERVNGLLKGVFDLDANILAFRDAHDALAPAIHRYTTIRTHWSPELKSRVYSDLMSKHS
jgi:putative transposase